MKNKTGKPHDARTLTAESAVLNAILQGGCRVVTVVCAKNVARLQQRLITEGGKNASTLQEEMGGHKIVQRQVTTKDGCVIKFVHAQ